MSVSKDERFSKELTITVNSSPPSTPHNVNPPSHQKRPSLSVLPVSSMTNEPSIYDIPVPDYTPTTSDPASAFYSHPQTRTSLEQLRFCTTNPSRLSSTYTRQSVAPAYTPTTPSSPDGPCPFGKDVDLELGEKLPTPRQPPPTYSTRSSFDPSLLPPSTITGVKSNVSSNAAYSLAAGGARKPCTVWPGKEHFRMKRKEMKRSRQCWPLRNLGKRQRRLVQVAIVLLVIGVAVAVGIGISIKTGGTVYKGDGVQGSIT